MESGKASGLAVASLVSSIIFLGGLGSLVAIILGWIAQDRIYASGRQLGGEKLADLGVILGWLGLVLGAALWFLLGLDILGIVSFS